jgi:Ca2+-transporting ATPase
MTPSPSWHSLSPQEIAAALSTDLESGLSGDEAQRRQRRDGFNELPEAPPPSLVKLFLSQFTSLIIWVLLGAAILSGLLEDWLDAAAIVAIVFLNGLLGFIQEFRAERSLAALRKMSVAMARVIREGKLEPIPARELVPGDLLVLESGDRIAADARLIYTAGFQTQEASLTGESTPVQKEAREVLHPNALLADRTNMAFMATIAVSGKSHAVVVATGLNTELGRIAGMIQQAAASGAVRLYPTLAGLGGRGDRVRLGLLAGRAAAGDVFDVRQPGGRRGAGRPSRGGHHHAGPRGHSNGEAPCADPETAGRGDAWLCNRYLHG